jgi:hypothetical protein
MIVTDVPSVIGLGLRTAAGFIAVVTALFYVTGRDLSEPETAMSLRWIVLLEAGYFLSLLPSGLLGLGFGVTSLSNFIESTLPCLVESIGIPILLAKLFFELSPKKPVRSLMKWALISGTFYLFVYWLNNSGNWIETVVEKGTGYVLKPANLFSFILTTVGLLMLTIYTANFSRKSFGMKTFSEFDLTKLGVIVTALGLYFDIIYVMYLFLNAVGGWGTWYAWFLNHNMDLWLLSLPLVGLPLLFNEKDRDLQSTG